MTRKGKDRRSGLIILEALVVCVGQGRSSGLDSLPKQLPFAWGWGRWLLAART